MRGAACGVFLRGDCLLLFAGPNDAGLAFVFEAIALALGLDDLAVMQERRSSMAAVRTRSPAKAWSQAPKLRFEVIKVEPFSYRAAMTWKKR